MSQSDIRWHQRLKNFSKALSQLNRAVSLSKTRELSELETQGLIQSFEYTHELAWNVLRDYFLDQGNTFITGSKDATREAFKNQIISDGEAWMEMIKSRNQTSHTYNQVTANDISNKIIDSYAKLFSDLKNKLLKIKDKDSHLC